MRRALRRQRVRWRRAQRGLEPALGLRAGVVTAAVILTSYLALGFLAALRRRGAPPLGLLTSAPSLLAAWLVPWIVVRQTHDGNVAARGAGSSLASMAWRFGAGVALLARLPLAATPWLVLAVRCGWLTPAAALWLLIDQGAFLALSLAAAWIVADFLPSRAALVPTTSLVTAGLLWLRGGGDLVPTLPARTGLEIGGLTVLVLLAALSATLVAKRPE